KAVEIACSPSVVDPNVLADIPAVLLQSLCECGDTGQGRRVIRGRAHEHANTPYSPALLRGGCERPRRCRAAEQRNELAPPHVEPPPPESVHRTFRLPYSARRVPWTELNCSE